jgi:hypothetical protein
MKAWLISLAGLVLFLSLAIFLQFEIQNTSEQFEREIKKANIVLNRQQWNQTLKVLNHVNTKWQKTKAFWGMLIIHREIDSIDEALIRTIQFTQSRNYPEAYVELGILSHYIKHIPEREKFNLVNIF